jgi:hypothetical protein
MNVLNMKLTSVYIIGGVMALATSLQPLMGATRNVPPAATPAPAGASDDMGGDNSNPYGIIVDRNIFHLNPQPKPQPVAEKPVDLPKVYLNGIVRVGDDVRVLFSIPPKDSKSQTAYFRLAPGEKDNELELVKIHPDQQEVDILVNGTAMTLSVLSNSMASAASGGGKAAPAAAAAIIANAPSAVVAGSDRSTSRYGGGGGGVTIIGGGNSSSSLGGGSGVAVASGDTSPAAYGGGGGASQIASALFSGTPTASQIVNNGPAASPEEQAIGLLAEYQKNPAGPPLVPPLAELVGQNTGVTTPVKPGQGGPPPVP